MILKRQPVSRIIETLLVFLMGFFLLLLVDGCICYCKRANIRGGFNFAMFAVDDFSAKLKPSRSFYNTSVYRYLLLDVRCYTIFREIKTTAKGPHQENREILASRN